jgi:hypothetical protein
MLNLSNTYVCMYIRYLLRTNLCKRHDISTVSLLTSTDRQESLVKVLSGPFDGLDWNIKGLVAWYCSSACSEKLTR